METNKKIEQEFTLYKQRLENLTQVINDLHNIVKNDEIVNSLKDPSLQKYRINRINQLVSEIINNQKQKIIIRVLQKYQQVSMKLKEKQKLNIGFGSKSKEKQNDIQFKQKYEKQLFTLKELIKEKDILIQQSKKQLQKQKEIIVSLNSQKQKQKYDKQCVLCNKLQLKITQLEQKNQLANKIIDKLKKDGQEAVENLNGKIKQLNSKNKILQSDINEKQIQLKSLKNQEKQKNNGQKRNQKIQVMKRQIIFLEEQLIEVQRQFNIVKDLGLATALSQVKKLKIFHKKLKEFCIQQIQNFQQDNQQLIQKLIGKIIKTKSLPRAQPIKTQKLMSKLNILDNQLDYFIQNQLLVE